MTRAAGLALAIVSATLLLASGAAAQIYRWTDEHGNPHYSEGLDSVPERHRAKARPLGLRNAPATPTAPKPAAPGAEKPTAAGGTTINFTPGRPIMVDARVNGARVRLLLDTGADRTLISPRALTAAGISLTRGTLPGQIVGVTGKADIQWVMVESLEVGEARVGRLLVSAHDMEDPSHDGLLGRDFLGQFNVNIDSSRGVVTLAPK